MGRPRRAWSPRSAAPACRRDALPSAAQALVEKVLTANTHACKLKVTTITLAPSAKGWKVSAKVSTPARSGWATWTIVGKKIATANPFAQMIARGCP